MTQHIDPCETARNNVLAAALALQQCTKTAANIVSIPGRGRFVAIGTRAEVARLLELETAAATTQASTAQAEPGSALVKHGDVPSIEITLRQAKELVDCFGGDDAEISIIRRPTAWGDMPDGLYAYFSEYPEEGSMYLGKTEVQDEADADAGTSSTDAQAAAEADELKRERDRFERMFVAACADLGLINEELGLDPDDGGAEPILDAIRALRAGDTGEQADGGAA